MKTDLSQPQDLLKRAEAASRVPIAVFGSGKGSNFAALLRAQEAGKLSAEFRVVVSDNPDAGILELAARAGIPSLVVREEKFRTRLSTETETWLAGELRGRGVRWVVLAGYMRVVKAPLLDAFPNRIVNIHPSLLPKFRGLAAWKQALEAGETETGCTVHLVNAELDAGPILGSARVPILPGDTPEILHARIQEAEHRLFPEVLQNLLLGDQSH